MKLIVHTQYGIFESAVFPEEQKDKLINNLNSIHQSVNFSFTLADGSQIYLSKELIQNSIFIMEK